MVSALELSLMGIGMVFFVLILLTLSITLLGRFSHTGNQKEADSKEAPLVADDSIPEQVVAVITASLAYYLEEEEQVQILSIKRIPDNCWRLSHRNE